LIPSGVISKYLGIRVPLHPGLRRCAYSRLALHRLRQRALRGERIDTLGAASYFGIAPLTHILLRAAYNVALTSSIYLKFGYRGEKAEVGVR
jgi:hypothetical protein